METVARQTSLTRERKGGRAESGDAPGHAHEHDAAGDGHAAPPEGKEGVQDQHEPVRTNSLISHTACLTIVPFSHYLNH